MLANVYMPERYKHKELFSSLNLPSDISEKFTKIDDVNFASKVENDSAVITFDAKNYLTYVFKENGKTLSSISGKNGEQKVYLSMSGSKLNVVVEYFYTLEPTLKSYKQINLIKTKNTYKSNDKWFM